MLLACLRDTMQSEPTRQHSAREPLLATSVVRDPDSPAYTPNSQKSESLRGYTTPSLGISHIPSCGSATRSCSISGYPAAGRSGRRRTAHDRAAQLRSRDLRVDDAGTGETLEPGFGLDFSALSDLRSHV